MAQDEKRKTERYKKLVERLTPNSDLGAGCLRAFWTGGLICTLGQAISLLGTKCLHLTAETAPMFTSVVLVFLGCTLTGLGVYDDLGRYAGAGTIVPITGFANSVTAPAMEFRREGMVLGLGAKLFTLAGPVLTYGISSSILVGAIYWAMGRWLG